MSALRGVVEQLRPSRQRRGASTWRLAGFGASVAATIASWFCGAVPREVQTVWPGLAPWRPNGGSPLAATVALLAVATMLYAWWALRDRSVTVRWHAHTAVIWFSPLLLSAPLFSRDIYSYAVQGLMLHEGLDPYSQGVRDLDSPWAESAPATTTPSPYGPLFLLLARLAVTVSAGHLLVAVFVLRLLAAGCVVVVAWAVPVIARSLGVDPVRATWLGVLCPLLGIHLVSGGHNDALVVAGTLTAFALALSGRAGTALLPVALATAVKAPTAVVMPFLAILWTSNHMAQRQVTWIRLVTRLVLATLVTLLIAAAASLALGLGFSWLPALVAPGRSVQWTSAPTAWGMATGAVGELLGLSITDAAVGAFRGLALVLLLVILLGLWRFAAKQADDHRVAVQTAGLAVLAVLVLAPSFRAWYFLWALPLLAASSRDRRALTAYGVVATVLALAVLPDGYSLALTTTWVGVPLMVLTTGVVLVVAARWARRHPWRELFRMGETGAVTDETKVVPDR